MRLAYLVEHDVDETRVIPDDFLDVLEPLEPGLDRRLGYTHHARYVCFWADGEGGVAWADGIGHGANPKAAWSFHCEVVPLAARYKLNVLQTSNRQQALVLDRAEGWAYFAPLTIALAFVGAK